MKKNLFVLFFALVAFYYGNLQAQCTLTDPIVQYNFSTPAGTSPDSCDINFDLTFTSDNNNGNKRIFIHLWTLTTYPAPPLDYDNRPTPSLLATSLGTIHIENPGATATLEGTYPDDGVKMLFAGLTLVVNTAPDPDQYTVKNITVRVPGACGPTVTIKGDIWSTQNNANNPSCSNSGFQFGVNNVVGALEVNCFTPDIPGDPQTYDLNFTTTSDPPGLSVTFTIWIDNGDNVYDAGTDFQIGGTQGPYNLSNGAPLSFIDVPYLFQSNGNFNILKDRTVWVVVTVAGFPNLVLSKAPNACTLLPVSLTSFTAVRKGKQVYVEWKTAREQNNAGFTLERLNTNGSVEAIAKIPSQAPNGSSGTGFTYRFEHLNLSSATTQYRLKQTGRDGNVEYSETRLVNGISGFRGAYVYPNPALGGKLRIYFNDAIAEKQLSLIDNTGRVIKQVTSKNVSQTEMAVPGPGIYHLSIQLPATGERMVQKVVVSN